MSDLKFASMDDQARLGLVDWSGVYFHGKAEDTVLKNVPADEEGYRCAPDLVAANADAKDLREGIHEGSLYGEPVYAYLWIAKQPRTGFARKLGLICLVGDEDARKYAAKRFNERAGSL